MIPDETTEVDVDPVGPHEARDVLGDRDEERVLVHENVRVRPADGRADPATHLPAQPQRGEAGHEKQVEVPPVVAGVTEVLEEEADEQRVVPSEAGERVLRDPTAIAVEPVVHGRGPFGRGFLHHAPCQNL